jgi:hypothetical protein
VRVRDRDVTASEPVFRPVRRRPKWYDVRSNSFGDMQFCQRKGAPRRHLHQRVRPVGVGPYRDVDKYAEQMAKWSAEPADGRETRFVLTNGPRGGPEWKTRGPLPSVSISQTLNKEADLKGRRREVRFQPLAWSRTALGCSARRSGRSPFWASRYEKPLMSGLLGRDDH